MRSAGKFCVNVLAVDQQELCQSFAKSGGDKFKDVPWTTTEYGSPRIEGCLAHIDCTIEAIYEAGDHDIVVGRVQDLVVSRSSTPLLFFQGQFESLSK
jgi:flavin reductase (DIM6/NTAB) family NADH-FMN oxidoreductase RutF